MSYDIIKSIKIKDNQVWVNCASNNVYPHQFEDFEAKSLSKILQEQGKEALDIEILRAYEEGNFQRGSNKYIRALKVLRHFSEYKLFNWRNVGKDYGIANKNRETPAFRELLKKALYTQLPKEKFIISKSYNGERVYLHKITKKSAKWCYGKERAKIFRYEADADNIKTYFTNSEDWVTKRLN